MGHSISIFMDKKKKKIIIIPVPRHIRGYGWLIDKPVVIDKPYDLSTIGEKARECFQVAADETPYHGETGFDFKKMGAKSHADFNRGKKNVSGYMDVEKGYYQFRPTKRHWGGGYGPISGIKEEEFNISIDTTDEEIGSCIMKAFEYCLT